MQVFYYTQALTATMTNGTVGCGYTTVERVEMQALTYAACQVMKNSNVTWGPIL